MVNLRHNPEARLVVGVCECLAWRRLYRFVITAACMLYWFIYDGQEHVFISTMYQSDKYGIVLVYAVVAVFTLNEEVAWIKRESGLAAFRVTRALSGVAATKVLLCTLIFKNNTSNNGKHSGWHIFFVVALAAVTVLTLPLARVAPTTSIVRYQKPKKTWPEQTKCRCSYCNWFDIDLRQSQFKTFDCESNNNDRAKEDGAKHFCSVWVDISIFMVIGVAFLVCVHKAENVDEDDPNRAVLCGCSVFLESILLSQSLAY